VRRFQADTAESSNKGLGVPWGAVSGRYEIPWVSAKVVLIVSIGEFVDLRNSATAVGAKTKNLGAQQVRTELLNLWPVYTMVQRYLRKTFRNASQVRSRTQAQCISSKQEVHDPGSKDLWCR